MARCTAALKATRERVQLRVRRLRQKFPVVKKIEHLLRLSDHNSAQSALDAAVRATEEHYAFATNDDRTKHAAFVSRHVQGVVDTYNAKYNLALRNPFL